jgi:hypothetical protein
MTGRARANGEGSIFSYRNGFAAYAWVTKPNGQRQRKYIYGKTREEVHEKWLKLQQRARQGPIATSVPKRLSVRDVQTWINEVARTCQCCAQGKDAARAENKRALRS